MSIQGQHWRSESSFEVVEYVRFSEALTHEGARWVVMGSNWHPATRETDVEATQRRQLTRRVLTYPDSDMSEGYCAMSAFDLPGHPNLS